MNRFFILLGFTSLVSQPLLGVTLQELQDQIATLQKIVSIQQARINETPKTMGRAHATSFGHMTYHHDSEYKDSKKLTVSVDTGGPAQIIGSEIIPYQMNDGSWRLRFNINLQLKTASPSVGIKMTGITYKESHSQTVTVNTSHTTWSTGRTVQGSDRFDNYAGSAQIYWNVSGDIELESKPTWAWGI